MSTKLLMDPGSEHTITDDLESHFFVLMWTALRWVKHNQAGRIDMEYIFDYQWQGLDGVVKGGAGKVLMYGGRNAKLRRVEFTCKPFNALFWDLWLLFAGNLTQRWKAGVEQNPGPGEYPERDLSFIERL